ncbi:serine hydrolase domain-containing protein [Synechococcus sp. 1G10]|uniref:serine hydrolase n=1 Tax=Synechococcus sp. 1G10 TaxID=2025605 RepID=UPI001E4802D6
MATLLLQLVDENKVSLDDKLSRWLPDIPNADRVTFGQLARMTSGYRDYVIGNDAFDNVLTDGHTAWISPPGEMTTPKNRRGDISFRA